MVYLGFGFEGIDNADDRRDLLIRSLYWMLDIVFYDGFEDGNTGAWTLSVP